MIQRKQTVYLLLALSCQILMLFLPIFVISAVQQGETTSGSFGAYGMEGEEYSQFTPIYLVFITLALLSIGGIMFYKKRGRQLLVCRINLIFNILLAIAISLFYYLGKNRAIEVLEAKGFTEVNFGIGTGFFVMVAMVPFLILAIRGIKDDDRLLKSIDRLRQ